jgi:hypothetical protein
MKLPLLLLLATGMGWLCGCAKHHSMPKPEDVIVEHFIWYDYTDQKSLDGYPKNCGWLVHQDNWGGRWEAFSDPHSKSFPTKEEAAQWLEQNYCPR